MKLDLSRHTFAHWLKVTLVLLASAVIVLWSWNAVMPEIFGLATVKYKHALGLLILVAGLSYILPAPSYLFRTGSRGPHGCQRTEEPKP